MRHSDHAETCVARTVDVGTCHLVDSVCRRIDSTGETIATLAVANDLDSPGRHLIPERSSSVQINRVPCQLDVCVPRVVRVGACNIRTPIAIRIRI